MTAQFEDAEEDEAAELPPDSDSEESALDSESKEEVSVTGKTESSTPKK